MPKSKVLYISGSIGLGHVIKDLAIATKLRLIHREVEITWIATSPAAEYLEEKGEQLHPLSLQFSSYSAFAEKSANQARLNLVNYVLASLQGWYRNVINFRRIIRQEQYDVIVGNETYEILIGLVFRLIRVTPPFIIIYDFFGLESMTKNPFEHLVNYILNLIWSRDHAVMSAPARKSIFIGEPEDIPDRKLGFLLPNRRAYARKYFTFIGYIIRFDPEDFTDKLAIRKNLGYQQTPLLLCSIGGTSIGKSLLELCNRTFPILRSSIPQLQMVLVTGPRLAKESLEANPGVEVKGFVPDLYQHFAACDLAVVQGGFSSTLELTALKRPFIYFPIEGHSEQEYVSKRLNRHQAGIRMDLSRTTPTLLAETILEHLDDNISVRPIKTDGAKMAARIIASFLPGGDQQTPDL
jgi:UDP-N-acetylglucosamine:LPS N-acetylglucosamine transferase